MKTTICFITCGLHGHIQESLNALLQYTPIEVEIVLYQNNTELPFQLHRGYSDEGLPHWQNAIICGGTSGAIDGIAVARNKCIKESCGEIIIWIDDDIIVCRDYVHAFQAPFATDDSVGIVGYDACKLMGNEVFVDLCHVDPFNVQPDYFDSPYAIRGDMIHEIGGYDENLGKYDCDNTDLCLRAYQNGWKLHPIVNPGIVHWMGSTRDILKATDLEHIEWQKSFNRMNLVHPKGWRQRVGLKSEKFEPDESLQFRPGELRVIPRK